MILILHKRTGGGVKVIDPDHMELNVTDIEISARFYKMILGFEEVFVFNHWAVLQIEKPALSIIKSSNIPSDIIHFKASSKEDVINTQKKLVATGNKLKDESLQANTGQISISFSDPSGNNLSLSFVD